MAWDVRVPPHAATLMHQHNLDYLFVTLGPATVTSVPYRGETVHMALHDGEIRYTKGPLTHKAINDGNYPFHNVTIELNKPSTNVTPCDSPCVFTSDQWTVSEMSVPPGYHTDSVNAFIVAISDVYLSRPRPGKPLRGGPGMVGDTQTSLTNAGRDTARFVLLEFK